MEVCLDEYGLLLHGHVIWLEVYLVLLVHRISYPLSLVKQIAVALIILLPFSHFTYVIWLTAHVSQTFCSADHFF